MFLLENGEAKLGSMDKRAWNCMKMMKQTKESIL